MLIEVKAKVAWKIDGKVKKKLETYIIDQEVFAQAEYEVMTLLANKKFEGTVDSYEITNLKLSIVKEVNTAYQGENTYIVTLRETYLQEDGAEKTVRYKVLLWADNITDAMSHAREIASQGYDMQIDSLKEVNYTYLNPEHNEEPETSED